MRPVLALVLAALVLVASGCGPEDDRDAPPPLRPVLSVVAKPFEARSLTFAGAIEPRYQTNRAFRVVGRIVTRDVDVGDLVRKGQQIASNDPTAYQLAVRASEAELASAQSQLEKTHAARARMEILVGKGVSSQADLDSAEQAKEAAAASVRQAEASLAKAREQLGYTTLTADIDGVVTAVNAQVGQMASPGSTVMTLARTDVREAVVDLPESVANALEPGAAFEIRLQADDMIRATGKVREIAPAADAATRLRRVRITLDQDAEPFRLGATIAAAPLEPAGPAVIELPASALLEPEEGGPAQVFLVDAASKSVRATPVEVGGRDGDRVLVTRGVEPGARVVVAGVHSLTDGQRIRIDGEAGR